MNILCECNLSISQKHRLYLQDARVIDDCTDEAQLGCSLWWCRGVGGGADACGRCCSSEGVSGAYVKVDCE